MYKCKLLIIDLFCFILWRNFFTGGGSGCWRWKPHSLSVSWEAENIKSRNAFPSLASGNGVLQCTSARTASTIYFTMTMTVAVAVVRQKWHYVCCVGCSRLYIFNGEKTGRTRCHLHPTGHFLGAGFQTVARKLIPHWQNKDTDCKDSRMHSWYAAASCEWHWCPYWSLLTQITEYQAELTYWPGLVGY